MMIGGLKCRKLRYSLRRYISGSGIVEIRILEEFRKSKAHAEGEDGEQVEGTKAVC